MKVLLFEIHFITHENDIKGVIYFSFVLEKSNTKDIFRGISLRKGGTCPFIRMSMSSPTFEEHVNEMVMNQLGALRKLRSPLTSYVASAIYIVLLCH